MSKMKFLNTYVDNLTMDEAVDAIDALVVARGRAYVMTPNVDLIVQAEEDAEYREIMDHADLTLTDGKPLIWISKWLKTPIKEKVSGSDLFPRVCERCAQKGYKMYFLGAAEGVAAEAARKLTARYPGLQVVDTYSPPYGFDKDPELCKDVVRRVAEAAPDVLIVGLSAPRQEKFIYHNLEGLNVPVSMGLGASLDFEAGQVRRAPRWMSNVGLEWLFRLLMEPKRMFGRYFKDFRRIIPIVRKYRTSGGGEGEAR